MAINVNNTTLKNGSTGSNVKEVQKALQAAGYDVGSAGADGIYGKKTAAAVKQYQKDNGLAVDGIAGVKTLTSLFGSNTSTTASNASTTNTNKSTSTSTSTKSTSKTSNKATATVGSPVEMTPFEYEDFTYESYTPSDTVNQANALLQQHQANKPGAYQSQWQDEIDDYLNQIQNRDPFSYDFNSDALYQQYKDNYIQQGQMAMMDTMGQAAAMTGGYGNSYAQSVGQQAYNQQLNKLNDIMPELYQMAYNRYADEGQRLMDMYNMYMGQESQDYGRYQDNLNNWYGELDYLTGQYNTERDFDYNNYQSNRELAYNQYTSDKNIAYDTYTTEQDRAWDEYLDQKKKEEAAANLMASAGNYDRLGDVYGLSSKEIAAIKKANTPVATSSGGSVTKKYKTLTHEDLATIQKNVDRATSVEDLVNLVSVYESMGYDPSVINSLTSGKYNSLMAGTGPQNTEVDTGTPVGAEELYYKNGMQYYANR